ncbi:sodium/calcium exchanger protein [Ditylenchus destructor]|nr:sodium/calcium exchanger protein [Ditylenchus destructor]
MTNHISIEKEKHQTSLEPQTSAAISISCSPESTNSRPYFYFDPDSSDSVLTASLTNRLEELPGHISKIPIMTVERTQNSNYVCSPTKPHRYRWRQKSRLYRWTRLLIAAPLLLGAVALFSWSAAATNFSDSSESASRDIPAKKTPKILKPHSVSNYDNDGHTEKVKSSISGKSKPYSLDDDLLIPLRSLESVAHIRSKRNEKLIHITANDVQAQRGRAHQLSTPEPKKKRINRNKNEVTITRRKILFYEVQCKRVIKLARIKVLSVLLHMFGLVYMFVALAIVCDEFFVPALGVITEKLDISEDVAGATFMAAGGSAPEFFTSVIGVFVAQNNVGIGTIVGSATFNILCVLAFCTLFSTTVLQLTWWPLFRDVTFYVTALSMLVLFFLDEQIVWWEALSLFLVYLCYALFMKFNADIENLIKSNIVICKPNHAFQKQAVTYTPDPYNNMGYNNNNQNGDKSAICKPLIGHKASTNSGLANLQRSDSLADAGRRRASSIATAAGRRPSVPILHSGAMFRNGIMQLMRGHELDPLSEGEGPENGEITPTIKQRKFSSTCSIKHTPENGTVIVERQPIMPRSGQKKLANIHSLDSQFVPPRRIPENGGMPRPDSIRTELSERRSTKAEIEQLKSILEEEEEKPLDISWPEKWHKRLIFLMLVPIILPLWATIPDVRKEGSKKWYPMTFLGSILWIAIFSYLMVWWANTIGETFGIPTEVIGLTILAAGTSIPDLITSVIVARKGLGDMAVSSSVGSNIFDVCVGLPIPWLLYFIIKPIRSGQSADAIPVSSNGLICSVGALFIMLLLLVAAIGICGWKMNKIFGVIMIISYIIFCVLSVSLETGRFLCPLRVC